MVVFIYVKDYLVEITDKFYKCQSCPEMECIHFHKYFLYVGSMLDTR